jgi:hypothetical protein
MSSTNDTREQSESTFSYGLKELREAEQTRNLSSSPPTSAKPENAGTDPYNTGRFDRKKNWSRVGRR